MSVNPNATYEPEDHKRESIELATPTKIGKVKIIDVLTSTAYKAGEALSAHMGYVLAQIGNASQYGRVKLSDNYTASAGAAADGVGASSAAVAAAYSALNSNKLPRFNYGYTGSLWMPGLSDFNLSKADFAALDGSCYKWGPQTSNNPNSDWGITIPISTGNGDYGWNYWIAFPAGVDGIYIKRQINQGAWTAWQHIT